MDTNKLNQLPVTKATREEFLEAQKNVSMKDPRHLRRWMEAKKRDFLVFVGKDLQDALEDTWPDGHIALQSVVFAYDAHRKAQESGELCTVKNVITGEMVEAPVFKTEELTDAELDRAIRWLVGQMYARRPDWKLENPSL